MSTPMSTEKFSGNTMPEQPTPKTYAQAIDDAIIIVLDRGRRIGGAIDPVKTAVALNALKRAERP